jgi:hypothetical protein
MPSPLFGLINKFVEDEWVKLDRQQITPWAFITAGPPFRVTDFYGHSISYQGILFEGSPEHVFWGRYIEPFLEDLVIRTMEETLRLASARRQDARQAMQEAGGLLKSVVRRAFSRMADIDRRLRGRGYPQSVSIRNVEGNVGMMERFVDERVRSELKMLHEPRISSTAAGTARTRIFISYSHADERWRKSVALQLAVLEKQGLLEVWDDRRIGAGEDWYRQIHSELSSAKVALLLISSSFLTSDFILREEIPRLFDKHHEGGMTVYPLLIKPCPWQEVPWLARLQLRPPEGKAIALLRGAKRDEALSTVAREIAATCKQA